MSIVKKLTMVILFGMGLFTSTIIADELKGQKTFLKKLKASCGFDGAKFARMHTQDEWEAIEQAGRFVAETKKICPKVKTINAVEMRDVYDFVYAYAKDSGNVPRSLNF